MTESNISSLETACMIGSMIYQNVSWQHFGLALARRYVFCFFHCQFDLMAVNLTADGIVQTGWNTICYGRRGLGSSQFFLNGVGNAVEPVGTTGFGRGTNGERIFAVNMF